MQATGSPAPLQRNDGGMSMNVRSRLRVRSTLALIVVLIAWGGCALQATTAPQDGAVKLAIDQPGLGFDDAHTLVTAFPLVNSGAAPASRVEVKSIHLESATLMAPTTFPLTLGTVTVKGRVVVESTFSSAHWVADQQYLLEVTGRYVAKEKSFEFSTQRRITLPPLAPGSAQTHSAEALPTTVTGAPYPHRDITIPVEENEPGPPVPTGSVRGDMTPTAPETSIETAHPLVGSPGVEAGQLGTAPSIRGSVARAFASPGNPTDLVLVKNTSLGAVGNAIPLDPSVASSGSNNNGPQTVFATGNTYAAFSTDGGGSFTQLDPTKIFPTNVDGGLCCDQVVHYSHAVNRYFWLMQFWAGANNQNRLRIASASPEALLASGGTAWTYWDLTSAFFGLGNNSMDFPDLSVGDKSLYVSVDAFGATPGLLVARIPLTELRDGGTIHVGYTHPPDSASAFGGQLTQNPGNEIFWVGHPTHSLLRIFSLKEGSNTYYWRDVPIQTYPFGDFTSLSPDGTDWLASLFSGGQAGTRVGDDLWFEWMGGRGGGFPQPQIQLVHIRHADFSVIQQTQIWSAKQAFGFASFTTNDLGLVGVSLAYGGGGTYGSPAVGILGQGLLYPTCISSKNLGRFGDYFTVRQAFPNSSLFSAMGYCVNQNSQYDPRYILFGRSGDVSPPPIG
jgi:hypothetical protein